MLLLDKPSQKAPFTLLFSEKIDPSLYNEAIKNAGVLRDSYNPETQTSNLSILAGTDGTSLTYSDTLSGGVGPFFGTEDDTQQSDT